MAGVKRVACRLSLNTFQRDVLLSAVNREISNIQATRDVPASLKMLAIEHLGEVKAALEESMSHDNEED